MSDSGDLTKFLGIENLCNNIPSRDSSMVTLKKKMNTIRNIQQTDAFGNITLSTYFGILVPLAEDNSCMTQIPIMEKFNGQPFTKLNPLLYPISPMDSTLSVDPKLVKFQFSSNRRISQTFLFTNT